MKSGRRAGGRAVVVHVAPAGGDTWTAGFVVSKKVGNSVARHQVTRRLRAIAAHRIPGAAADKDVVVRALPGAAARTYQELDNAVAQGLAQAAA
jgi:ribonuclease P protein component